MLASVPVWAAAPLTSVPASRLARLTTGANVCLWFRFPRNESLEHFHNYLPDSEMETMKRIEKEKGLKGIFSK